TNATGATVAVLNSSQLNPAKTAVPAMFTGTVTGPIGTVSLAAGHTAELDILVNGVTKATLTSANGNFIDQGFNAATQRDTISYSTNIPFTAGESTNSVSVLFKNILTTQSVTPISGFQVTVDTISPQVSTLGPVTSPTTTPVGSVPVVFGDS